MSKIYLNGQLVERDQACISPLDRGFLFADAAYEVIPVYNRELFRFYEHITRLKNSLEAIHINNPYSLEQWQAACDTVIMDHIEPDQALYLQVTRGVEDKRDHLLPQHIDPTVFIMTNPMPLKPEFGEGKPGIRAVTVDDFRWNLCHIKSTALLANVLAKHQATLSDADESILIRDGYALEGSASNLFIVKGGRLITPPKNNLILGGITRDVILQLAQDHGITANESQIALEDLFSADEFWLTSSIKEIIPVTQLDDQDVANGKTGPIYQQISTLFNSEKTRHQDKK